MSYGNPGIVYLSFYVFCWYDLYLIRIVICYVHDRKSSCDVGSDTTVVNGTVAAGNDVSTLLNGTCRKRRMLFNRNDNSLATVSFMPQVG